MSINLSMINTNQYLNIYSCYTHLPFIVIVFQAGRGGSLSIHFRGMVAAKGKIVLPLLTNHHLPDNIIKPSISWIFAHINLNSRAAGASPPCGGKRPASAKWLTLMSGGLPLSSGVSATRLAG